MPNSIAKTIYPLSYGQEAIWFIYQIDPDSIAYNIFITVKINSYLNIAIVNRVWNKIIEHHPILRTTYTSHEGKPVQQINQKQKFNLEITDASNWNQDHLKEKIFAITDRPFNLEKDSVLRVNLFTISAKEHILLLTMHHIAGDMWSFDLLLSEFQALYANEIEQDSQEQTEAAADYLTLNKSYLEFVRWQSEMLSGSRGEKLWQYWQQKLAGELPILNLLADKPRPIVQTYQGKSYISPLDEQLIQKLKHLALASGTSLYQILLAAFYVQLYRYTNQTDILIGSPMRGRWGGDFQDIVGYFVNLIVLRTAIQENATFKEFLTQVSNTVKDAQKHQDYPFSQLAEQLQPQRDPSRSPLCQVSFTWQRQRWCESTENLLHSREQVLEMEPYLLGHQRGADSDMNLMVMEAQGVLQLCWQYNTDLFEACTITRMAGHFVTLLEGIVANPEERIWQLPLLTAVEQQQLLVEWNNTQTDYLQDKCIHQLFEEQVERTPDSVAVVFENQQLTYHQLNCRANQLAYYLRSLGVGADVLVGICVERSLEMVVGLLGILKAGGAYVPLDPDYPQDRLTFMLEDAQAPVLLTQQQLLKKLPQHQAQVVCLDTDWQSVSQLSQENPITGVQDSNLAYVIYTSGSTGKPKGAMNTHLGIYNRLLWMQQAYQLTAADCILQKTPFSFDVSVWEFFWPLLNGARLVLAKPGGHKDSAYLVNLILEQQVTTLHFVPSMLQVFLEEQSLKNRSSLKRVICSGETLPLELQERFFARLECELHNLYGPTEAAIDVTYWQCKPDTNLRTVPIGRPIANTQIYILDSHLQSVAVGVAGELHIGGLGLARGYLKRPELTKEKFIHNPFEKAGEGKLYKTGDLARYLPDGNIEYLGRIDNQVKIRGFRIELGEIEAVLNQHSDVQVSCVIPREDNPGDKRLVVYVVPHEHCTPIISELRQYLKAKVPDYMVPNAFVILKYLPLTPNGKIDPRALPAPSQSRDLERFVAPRNQLELQLVQIWSQILKVDEVGVKDNFFDIGGHSLLVPYLLAQIQQQFGKSLPLVTLFQHPTIEELAELVQKEVHVSIWSPLVALQPNGSNPPLFCIPGAGGNPFYLHNLARCLGSDQPFYSFQTNHQNRELVPITEVEDIAGQYIQALQAVQPQGPYFLAGHSFGGKVVYEMAQQLLRQGQVIALVAILDTTAPNTQQQQNEWDDEWDDNAMWLIGIAKTMQIVYAKDLDMDTDILPSLDLEAQFKHVLEYLKRLDILPLDADTTYLKQFLQALKADNKAKYVPQQVDPVSITLLRTSQTNLEEPINQPEILQDLDLGWNKFSAEPVNVYFVPGNHVTIITQPYVQVLAERLKACIEQAKANI
ncbi:non-ribosomal peptide synthetase [Nostoc sp.]|uniref:non-ribosomal peptide synthetase n=1 Tax=Nostoc sp. TaxID=1180 RepID=UPI002FF57B91